jgi:type VI secretion system secreted protein VgrG
MPAYSQDHSVFRLMTPLGKDVLLLRRIKGTEGIAELFDLELEALATNDTDISFDALLGQCVTVSVYSTEGTAVRWFHGLCIELEEGPRETLETEDKTFTSWRLRIAPNVWVLGLAHRSRVFQEVTVPTILQKIFDGFSTDVQLERQYEPREMCLQYRESDLAFACRLMEEEGIRWYFRHADGNHTLVITDSGAHASLPGPSPLYYDPLVGGVRDEDRIAVWNKKQALTRGKVTLRDRSFEVPTNDLEKISLLKDTLQVGSVSHKLRLANADRRELYGFPGGHAKPFDGVAPGGGDRAGEIQKIFPYGDLRARVVMEREETRAVEIEGAGDVRHMVPGFQFVFGRHHDGDGAYVLTRLRHDGENSVFRSDNTGTRYENAFTCLPASAAYRPARRTRRPVAQGPETAIVVGPAGEDIYVDKYGRIKVQFYWDREGKKDPSSCAWLRVATPLAGSTWGTYAFPRIGQEVLVAFQHGDPDEPVVIGALYNAENMPPYTLPANMRRTGIRTRSTLRGTAEECHEVRLDDTKDAEEIFVQSQKDFHRLVKNNDWLQVGVKKGNTEPPDGSQKREIWKDRTTTLNMGNDKLVVGVQAERKSSPSMPSTQGNQVLEVLNDRTATVKYGNDKLTIEKGNLDIKLEGMMPDGKVTIEAPNSIELKVGANFVKLDTMGIELKFGTNSLKMDMISAELKTTTGSMKLDAVSATLKGITATVKGDGMAEVKAPLVNVKADAMLMVGGGLTKLG